MNYKVNASWFNVNRACNLRCSWCYAQNSGFSEDDKMDYDIAIKTIDLLIKNDVKKLVFIGGEPTLYKDLSKLINYANINKIKCGLITNGLKISDENYLFELIDAGLRNINISVKAYNEETYNEITKVSAYSKVLRAIHNLKKSKINFTVSFVITENIENIVNCIKDCKDAGANNFSFSFCYKLCDEKKDNPINPFSLISAFVNKYDEINEVTEGRIKLRQSLPLCLFEKEFINKLIERKQISSICQLQSHSGLIFDTNFNIIVCNSLFEYPIENYPESLEKIDNLNVYWNNEKIINIHKSLNSVPDEICIKCNDYKKCGGGCLIQWTNYNMKDLLKSERRICKNE